jgi:hypothetical protein
MSFPLASNLVKFSDNSSIATPLLGSARIVRAAVRLLGRLVGRSDDEEAVGEARRVPCPRLD